MRGIVIILAGLLAGGQTALDRGTPEAAFTFKLTAPMAARLRAHYQGDHVPLIPQPFRSRLDAALTARDWTKLDTAKKAMTAAHGPVMALAWEQSRFVATGGLGIAELHAQDIAASGASAVAETAAMLWLYAVAVTMTDGHKCAESAAKDAHLDRLRGPDFEPVSRIIRVMAEDRVTAMRDLAIRLEAVLAPDRNDDTVCRTDDTKPAVKPDPRWRPDAAKTRAMLAKHLTALTSVMRPKRVEPRK